LPCSKAIIKLFVVTGVEFTVIAASVRRPDAATSTFDAINIGPGWPV